MGFLFTLLVVVIVFGLIYWIVTLLPIPEPFKKIAVVVVLVIFLLYMLSILFGIAPAVPLRLR
jgi:hypothetical protein